jgi:hypothetical protein
MGNMPSVWGPPPLVALGLPKRQSFLVTCASVRSKGRVPVIEEVVAHSRSWIDQYLSFLGLHCIGQLGSSRRNELERPTSRPRGEGKRNHLRVHLNESGFCEESSQFRPNSKILPIFQRTEVLCTPFSQSMLIGDRAIVGLNIKVYLNHLDPTSWLQYP